VDVEARTVVSVETGTVVISSPATSGFIPGGIPISFQVTDVIVMI